MTILTLTINYKIPTQEIKDPHPPLGITLLKNRTFSLKAGISRKKMLIKSGNTPLIRQELDFSPSRYLSYLTYCRT